MARYIDADRIVFWVRHVSSNGLDDDVRRVAFSDEIARIPTVDVAEVVRCKNCEYYMQNEYSPDEDMMCMCWCDWLPTDPDDFCSNGKRKTD